MSGTRQVLKAVAKGAVARGAAARDFLRPGPMRPPAHAALLSALPIPVVLLAAHDRLRIANPAPHHLRGL